MIIYFYGKIIYHLYLNLNIEELMETPVKYVNKKANKKSKSTAAVETHNQNDDILMHTVILSTKTTNSCGRKKSGMRVENLNRTRNLKKSIKVMIIIIALFLLSWLPIHLYRILTTYIPFFQDLSSSSSSSSSTRTNYDELNNDNNNNNSSFSFNQSLLLAFRLENCKKNTSDFNCITDMIKDLQVQNIKINTLHNRYVFFICYFMSMSSVCYNPIVYFWMHKKFRSEVKQLFSRLFALFRCGSSHQQQQQQQLHQQTNHSNTSTRAFNTILKNNNSKNSRLNNRVYFKKVRNNSTSIQSNHESANLNNNMIINK